MANPVDQMIVAKDQFFTWAMFTTKPSVLFQPAEDYQRSYSVFSARNAIYLSLPLLGLHPKAEILVPAYICRAAVDPLFQYGLNVQFYNVNRNCEVDMADLQRRIGPQTKAILAVHYFGFPQRMREVRDLCDARGLKLIEDCAHVLKGMADDKPMGMFGDAAVFSWRKFLPVYDGGELVMNGTVAESPVSWVDESLLFTLKVAANMMDASLSQTRRPLPRLAYGGLRAADKVFRRALGRRTLKAGVMKVDPGSVLFDQQSVNLPMSRLSQWARRHSSIPDIIAIRRKNYETLGNELSGTPGAAPVYCQLPAEVCPWVFPVVFQGVRQAHLRLRSHGVPAVTWDGVRHELIPSHFEDAHMLYEGLVFLPVHQCLQADDMVRMARAIRESLEEPG